MQLSRALRRIVVALSIFGLSAFMARYSSGLGASLRSMLRGPDSTTARIPASQRLTEALNPQSGYLLQPLLKPRVPGTAGALAARAHIAGHLEKFGWSVDIHEFEAVTPIGSLPMANIVARRGSGKGSTPPLTLAAHYDSKRLPEGFVGAIDSAFPCALMLWLASITDRPLKRDFDLIFFDGEEAMVDWSDEDSIYGAKALAKAQKANNALPRTLVLLDLLGDEARFPIASWFPATKGIHRELQQLNPRLIGGRDLHEYAGMMQDDHLPYLDLGVPVLHIIPAHFPDVWHTQEDDASALHWDSMQQWAELFERYLYDDEGE